jgi:plastocyanin
MIQNSTTRLFSALFIVALLALGTPEKAQATRVRVGIQGLAYTPLMVDLFVGDTLVIAGSFSSHPTTEVSAATYTNNGTTPLPGGFAISSGNQILIPITNSGNRFWVCDFHVGAGMKGMSMAAQPTAAKNLRVLAKLAANPTPTTCMVTLEGLTVPDIAYIYNTAGRLVTTRTVAPGQPVCLAGLAPGVYSLRVSDRRYPIVKQ